MQVVRILAAAMLAIAISGSALAENETEPDSGMAEATAKFQRDRRQLIESNLQLTETEAARFWPVYERFQRELAKVTEKRRSIIAEFGENYDDMSDAMARKIMLDRIELEEIRYRLMKEFYPSFESALPIKKLARYYQIESKIHYSVEAGIAEELPLVK